MGIKGGKWNPDRVDGAGRRPATRDIWQGARIAKMSAAYSGNLRRSIGILRVSRDEVRFVVQSELYESSFGINH